MRKILFLSALAGALALSSAAQADGFVNGGFETGDASGWTGGTGRRVNVLNPLNPSDYAPGGSRYIPTLNHSSIIAAGTVDPRVGAAFGTTVAFGNYSYRVEDTTTGGYASVIQQRVNNYTNPTLSFAWKAVLLGAHGLDDAASMVISLKDMTAGGTELLRREYNAASSGSGVDPRFSLSGSNYYTANWQTEVIDIAGLGATGHDILLQVLGADCEPTGHWGYVYLDGFSTTSVPGGVPEPSTWAMMLIGFAGLAFTARRRKQAAVAA